MIQISLQNQTYSTFFIKYKGVEYEFYKYNRLNYRFKNRLLLKISNELLNTNLTLREFYTEYENIFDFGNFINIKYFLFKSIKDREYNNNWNYLIHSTFNFNIEKLLKNGVLDTCKLKERWNVDANINKIFTTYIFSDLIYNGNDWNFYGKSRNHTILVFDIKLLQEDNIVCPSAQFGYCSTEKDIFSIKNKTNMNELKNYINDTVETYRRMKNYKLKYDANSYAHSHEILFDKIDLRKYLKAILVEKDFFDEIENLLEEECYYSVKIIKYSNFSYNYKKYFEKINCE